MVCNLPKDTGIWLINSLALVGLNHQSEQPGHCENCWSCQNQPLLLALSLFPIPSFMLVVSRSLLAMSVYTYKYTRDNAHESIEDFQVWSSERPQPWSGGEDTPPLSRTLVKLHPLGRVWLPDQPRSDQVDMYVITMVQHSCSSIMYDVCLSSRDHSCPDVCMSETCRKPETNNK